MQIEWVMSKSLDLFLVLLFIWQLILGTDADWLRLL